MATVSLGTTWTSVAADITAITLVQVQPLGGPYRGSYIAEFVAAGSLPAESVDGVSLVGGEAISSAMLPDFAASGALYGRSLIGVALNVTVL